MSIFLTCCVNVRASHHFHFPQNFSKQTQILSSFVRYFCKKGIKEKVSFLKSSNKYFLTTKFWFICLCSCTAISKGQLISEWNFGVFKSPKKPTQILERFLPYKARAENCEKFCWLFGRFNDTKISFWD